MQQHYQQRELEKYKEHLNDGVYSV